MKKNTPNNQKYRITVDNNLSMAEMITVGKYDWGNKDVNTKNFPMHGKGTTDLIIELVCFEKFMKFHDVLRELQSRDLRPGTLPELLAFGAKYPKKQLEFPILQVGSVWPDRGGRRVVFLRKGNKERGISVVWTRYGWGPYYRFIAVKKEISGKKKPR